jgi:hypothetical protein
MNLPFVKINKCPCCNTVNINIANGAVYDNKFCSLQDYIIKKIFNCRKCKQELGLFFHNLNKTFRLVWIDYLKCEDKFYLILNKLYEEKKKKNKCQKILKEIASINNKIYLNRIRLKIKVKIQNHGMSINYLY